VRPLDLKRILRDHDGLLARLELSFALERPKIVRPVPRPRPPATSTAAAPPQKPKL
jgi:hypothetical protein